MGQPGSFGYQNSPITQGHHAQPSMMANQAFSGHQQYTYQQ
jgi:hypothetical protein